MSDIDCYVALLEVANDWYDLGQQEDDPTEDDWNVVHDALADAVDAVREFEASEGTWVRDDSWGGSRVAVVEVLDAASAWYDLSFSEEEPDSPESDAVLDRLGASIEALRVAEEQRDVAELRGVNVEELSAKELELPKELALDE